MKKKLAHKIRIKPFYLLLAGMVMAIITPFIGKVLYYIFTMSCPNYGGERMCGLEGIGYSFQALTLSAVWLVIGLIIIGLGIYRLYAQSKK